MTFNEACTIIMMEPKNPGNMAYAKSYAHAGINMTGEARRVQALYILSNLSHWRGDNAKKVRAYLKTVR